MIGFEPMSAGYPCYRTAPNPRGLTAWLHLDKSGILQYKRIVPRKKKCFPHREKPLFPVDVRSICTNLGHRPEGFRFTYNQKEC